MPKKHIFKEEEKESQTYMETDNYALKPYLQKQKSRTNNKEHKVS